MMGWPDQAGSGWLMALLMLTVVVITAGALVMIVSAMIRGPRPGDQPAKPLARDLIDLRLARGEIDEDEYLRLMSLLDAR